MTLKPRSGPRDHVPSFNENNRQTGARKLEARLESTAHRSGGRLEADFGEDSREAAARADHLMEPVDEVQGKTHSADGRNPSNQGLPERDPNARYGEDGAAAARRKGAGPDDGARGRNER